MRSFICMISLFTTISGCGKSVDTGDTGDTGDTSQPTATVDLDNDGYSSDVDCDDSNDAIHPDADEICDGLDNNCDDSIDGSDAIDATTFYLDDDGDSYGDPETAVLACEQGEDHSLNGDDCDDDNSAVYPSAPEVCRDGLVNDCDLTEQDVLGACPINGSPDLSNADLYFFGESSYDYAAYTTTSAGDVDGDGREDLLIGAPGYGQEIGIGRVYLILGADIPVTGEVNLDSAVCTFNGDNEDDLMGIVFTGGGDLDGDGLSDVALGQPDGNNKNGYVTVFLGKNISPNTDFSPSDADYYLEGDLSEQAGSSLAFVNDIDGDGNDELLVGAETNSYDTSQGSADKEGAAYMVFSSHLQSSSNVRLIENSSRTIIRMSGMSDDAYTGSAVASMGDMNGDGFGDFAINSPTSHYGAEDAGAVFVVSGADLITNTEFDLIFDSLMIYGVELDSRAGHSIANAGDVDGDGTDDLLIGSPMLYEERGGAYLFLGSTILGKIANGEIEMSVEQYDFSFSGENIGDAAGYSLSGIGDMDNDGLDDIAISSPFVSDGANSRGMVYAIFGERLTTSEIPLGLATISFMGEDTNDRLGISLSGPLDINADGFSDIVLGSLRNSQAHEYAGKGYISLGNGI
jgi:hypothetical protein